jgi:hypothetical protein
MTAEARPVEQFDFTNAQWQAIRYAVIDGCDFPHTFEEYLLRCGANDCLQRMRSYPTPTVEKKKWKRLLKQLAQARDTLMTVARCDCGTAAYLGVILDDDGWRVHPGELKAGGPSAKNILALLDDWIFLFADRAKHGWRPRDLYFYRALDCWEDAGGHFRFSRAKPGSQHEGRPGGPTIRYLEAVSRPLMGKGTPSAEALAKIIERRAKKPGTLGPRLARHLTKLEVASSPAQARRIVRAISRLTDV